MLQVSAFQYEDLHDAIGSIWRLITGIIQMIFSLQVLARQSLALYNLSKFYSSMD